MTSIEVKLVEVRLARIESFLAPVWSRGLLRKPGMVIRRGSGMVRLRS
jgi:hypothetical protein